jgi:hypothetical protein
MFLNSIDRKPFFSKADGAIIRDLTQTMFDFNTNNYVSFQAYRVPLEYQMRIDLISQSVYNNTLYAEYILKYNGISNPFSISDGDVILIPNLDSAKENTKNTGVASGSDAENRIRNSYKYLDPTKAPVKDGQVLDFDNRNLQEEALPPNISQEGEAQVVYRNGRVYFGENIGNSACLKNGMSSSEFLASVIRSRKV